MKDTTALTDSRAFMAASTAAAATSVPEPLHVHIDNGPSFVCGPQEDSLLRAALRAGLAFPYECSVGGCGACRFELLSGDMHTLWADSPGLSPRDRQRGKRLACQSRPLGECQIRVRLGPTPTLAPPPPRRSSAILSARRWITSDMVELSLRLEQPTPFYPGQYALLYPAGVMGARAYSLSHIDTGDGVWRFIVRKVTGGSGSTVLCDHLAVGQGIEVDGPFGHAWLHPSPRDVVCVAGGSGLGPMLSVARGVLAESSHRCVHFFLGLRHEAELGALAEVEALACDRLSLHVTLSAPTQASTWTGHTGFVHTTVAHTLGRSLPLLDFYFAGPPPMIDAMQDLLVIRHQVPVEQIRFDRYV